MKTAVKNPALRYYGGKFRLGGWVASNLPPHVCYVEPFGGAAGVLLRKEPSNIEVYNDLDGAVVNFFKVLREQPQNLIRQLKRTPFAREEFHLSFEPSLDPLEEARRFFVLSWQSYGGPCRQSSTGWKVQKREWVKSRANQMGEWHSAIRNLSAVARRFHGVQVERDDALKVIQRFDTAETVFYCDPPYPSDTRNISWCKTAYAFEFSTSDHVHLANQLKRIKGAAIVSTYPNELYDELYAGWERVETTTQTMNKTIAKEMIFISPPKV